MKHRDIDDSQHGNQVDHRAAGRARLSAGAFGRVGSSCGTAGRFPHPPPLPADTSVGSAAETETVKPNARFETPWKGSRVRTQSAGRVVSGSKSATAWESQTPLAWESRTKFTVSV